MDRRELLKLLGAAGALPLLGSLAPEQLLAAARLFHERGLRSGPLVFHSLTAHEGATVAAIAEAIIPETDTPGATKAGVPQFIDLLFGEWYEDGERAAFRAGLREVDARSRVASGKDFVRSDAATQTTVLKAIVPEPASSARDLFQVMNWIEKNISYDHGNASLKADPNHALSQRAGHCSDYHGLCAALGRALGYPTRVTYGLMLYPKNSPSHCRIEAYLPPYGWVSFDLSETQQMIQRIQADKKLDAKTRDKLTQAARARLLGRLKNS